MGIRFLSNTILKPHVSTEHLISSDVHVKVPLTIFDKAAFDIHVAILYAFRPPTASNTALKEGLSKALSHFPHLAGRLISDENGNSCILLNNAGIRLIETYVPTTLVEQLPLTSSSEMSHLVPPCEGIEELQQIQLNRYACGGLVIGQTAHHRVADGHSMSSFFLAWARLVRGLDLNPIPYHDRAAVSIPRNPPKVDFNHHSIEFHKGVEPSNCVGLSSIENLAIHFSANFMSQLKAKVTEGDKKYSTFECLLAHLWKKITQARGVSTDEYTQVRVAVDGRPRLKPPVPMEYFGNLVLCAYPRLRAAEVLQESHSYVAKAIHEAVTQIDNQYFQSFIDFGETIRGGGGGEEVLAAAHEMGSCLYPHLEVHSWLSFKFHDLDFGWGGPCAFLPPNLTIEGLVIFVPSCTEKGGVDVFMTLLREHVHTFQQICHSLEKSPKL